MFSSGTLFIAKCALPHEQSVAGALFSVMTQVCIGRLPRSPLPLPLSLPISAPCLVVTGLFVRWKHRTRADVDRWDAWAAQPVLVDRVPRLAPLCLIPRKPCTLMRTGGKRANWFWAAWDLIRARDNDDRLQLRFGKGFSVTWGRFGRAGVTCTPGCTVARVSRRELGGIRVWCVG